MNTTYNELALVAVGMIPINLLISVVLKDANRNNKSTQSFDKDKATLLHTD